MKVLNSTINLQYSSKKLLDTICGQWKKDDIARFSSELLDLRNKIEDLKENQFKRLIADIKAYITLGESQSALASAQSKLVKKSLQLFEDPQEFYNKIETVWQQVRGECAPTGLGEHLAKTDRKNPIVLCALDAYVRTEESGLKSPFFIGFKKHFHQTISPSDYMIFQSALSPNFYKNIFNDNLKDLHIKEERDTAVDYFIRQNLNHPLIRMALLEEVAVGGLKRLLEQSICTLLESKKLLPSCICRKLEKNLHELVSTKSFEDFFENRNRKLELKQAIEQTITDYQQEIEELKKEAAQAPLLSYDDKPFFSTYTICDPDDLNNPDLASNLKIGYEALLHAIERLPFSSNYILRENFRFSMKELPQIKKNLVLCTKVYRKQVDDLFLNKNQTSNFFLKHQLQNKLSNHFIVGNCVELSSVAFMYLLKQKHPRLNVEMLTQKFGDHGFVMLGREGDLQNPKTWGKIAVIIDPWMREVYPARLFEDLLKSYKGRLSNNGMPCLEKFNPDRQQLDIVTEKMMFSKDYEDLRRVESKEIKELLDNFHKVLKISEKIDTAQKILIKLPHPDSTTTKQPLTLRSQLQYFLKIYSKAQN